MCGAYSGKIEYDNAPLCYFIGIIFGISFNHIVIIPPLLNTQFGLTTSSITPETATINYASYAFIYWEWSDTMHTSCSLKVLLFTSNHFAQFNIKIGTHLCKLIVHAKLRYDKCVFLVLVCYTKLFNKQSCGKF